MIINKNFQLKRILPILLIIALAAFLRLYHIDKYMNFLGDEGRDVLVVKRMIVDHRWTLLGPRTSVGNMHLGPLYYYLMAIPLLLTNFNPVGPAVMIAFFGVATVFLVYEITRLMFKNQFLALISSFLYATSPIVLEFSRSSWNPNIAPFFSAVIILFLYKLIKTKQFSCLLFIVPSMFVLIQSHYVTLAMFPFIFAWLIYVFIKLNKKKKAIFIKKFSLGLILGIIIIGPYLLFNFRHQFISLKEVVNFLEKEPGPKYGIFTYLDSFYHLIRYFYAHLLVGGNEKIASYIVIFSLIGSVISIKKIKLEILFIFSLIISGIFISRFYSGQVHHYYLGFLFPAVFISVVGSFYTFLIKKPIFTKIFLSFLSFYLACLGLSKSYLFSNPSNQLKKSRAVGEFIALDAKDKKFNLAMISPLRDYRAMPYRYFAELASGKFLDYVNYKDDDYLYVILEEDADVLSSPIYEIREFGPVKKVDEFIVFETRIEKYTNKKDE